MIEALKHMRSAEGDSLGHNFGCLAGELFGNSKRMQVQPDVEAGLVESGSSSSRGRHHHPGPPHAWPHPTSDLPVRVHREVAWIKL